MKFQDSKFWKNYSLYDKRVMNSSMRSTVDGLIYWRLLNAFKFDSFLEIGVYQGLTTGLFFESNPKANVTGIDPNNKLELFYFLYPEHQTQFEFFNEPSQNVDLKGRTYDFVLVDGDHSYQAARQDIFKALECLKPNSILAIDDYNLAGVAKAIRDLYNTNSDWVPFLQAEQTQFWHNKNCDRNQFIDSLLVDPLSNFIFVENICDEFNNTICSAKTLKIFTDFLEYFDQALTHYNI
jgi:hypothetical protein